SPVVRVRIMSASVLASSSGVDISISLICARPVIPGRTLYTPSLSRSAMSSSWLAAKGCFRYAQRQSCLATLAEHAKALLVLRQAVPCCVSRPPLARSHAHHFCQHSAGFIHFCLSKGWVHQKH